MDVAVYVLSTLISLACAVLLLRSFLATRSGLLFWAGICFIGFTLNNVILFLDKVVVTGSDFSSWRTIPALVGVLALIYGLLWERTGP
jgi:Family of unknown function (DUF5985)